MKKLLPNFSCLKFLCAFVILLSVSLNISVKAYAATSDFVTSNGKDFSLNGTIFKSIGVNRYNLMTTGGNPFVGCGGTFSESDLNTWFSELHQMGVSSVRFWLFQQFTQNGTNLQRFEYLLSLALQYNIKLIPVFENQWGDCTQAGYKDNSWYQTGYKSPYGSYPISLKDYIGKIVPLYKNNPQIMMWQIMNEAESGDTASFYNFAKDVSEYIKSQDNNHLVSFGTMGSGQPGNSVYKSIHTLSSIDVLEYHDYNTESVALPPTLSDRFNDSVAINKPLIVDEAGIDLNNFSSSQRADYLKSKMTSFFQKGGAAYLIWSYRNFNTEAQSYDFNFTDPLTQDIIDQTTAFHSPSQPTPTNGLIPSITRTPTPTSTPVPTVDQKLGGMDLDKYCRTNGSQGAALSGDTWVCASPASSIDLTGVCQSQFNTSNATSKQEYSGNPYSWSCYYSSGNPATIPTISVTQKLGGLDLDKYCKSKGSQGTVPSGDTWVCASPASSIDLSGVCQSQYNTSNAAAKQEYSGNPYSWSCFTK